jgi:hypothetical protein
LQGRKACSYRVGWGITLKLIRVTLAGMPVLFFFRVHNQPIKKRHDWPALLGI